MRLSATNSSSTSCTRSSSGGHTCTWNMKYHMFGNNNAWNFSVYVQQGTGGSATNTLIHTVDGYYNGTAVNTSSSDAYKTFTYDLMPSFAGQDVRIILLLKAGPYALVDGSQTMRFYQCDTAVDDMKVITNGVSSDYSGYNSTQRSKWQQPAVTSSSTVSIALQRTFNLAVQPAAPATGSTRRWAYDTGTTASNGTGPNGRANGSASEEYIYFEGTIQTLPNANPIYYPLRMTDTFSVPS